jgi:succinate dehydrogenase/fumarate reductase cytochrome b subunit (b558 family)
MTTPATAPLPDDIAAMRGRRHFVLRRLHSLSGVVPVGVFLVTHLWTNARALYGRDSFNHAVGEIQSMPFLAWVEVFAIFLPLLFHAGYGVVIAAQGSANVTRYGYTRNWMYVLQRVTGLVAFAFIALHLWQYRVQKALGAMAWQEFYGDLGRTLGGPAMFAVYLVGITASVFHFANGLWLFGNTWGVTLSPRAMRRSAFACGALGFALWALGFNTLLHFSYRCGGVIPTPEQQVERMCRDADTASAPARP